jgi:transposase-like protein
MRYSASEKLEIIRLVEESTLPVRRTLEKIAIPHATFYRWYDLYHTGGPEALEDQQPKPDRVWNAGVARLVGIKGGVVSGVFNLESSDVGASDRRPRHDDHYHEA